MPDRREGIARAEGFVAARIEKHQPVSKVFIAWLKFFFNLT